MVQLASVFVVEFAAMLGAPAQAQTLESQRTRLLAALNRWARRQSQRTTISDAQIEARRGTYDRKGILIGYWDEAELPPDVRDHRRRFVY